ncbi:SGNH/GDSL hydrolase family protein [Actinoplanes sp. NPDC048791]|uniref:SGNH/GDSL hydrolase family protein n=1 Tax=Actinoplanes sp. NPDC048791 TaxID=3154623 RepID=UPI0033F3A839
MTGIDYAAVRRTCVFAVALILLLFFARSGASSLTIQVWFTLFVIAATLWVRGQYMDSLDDRQWLISRRAGAVLLVVAVALVASYEFRPRAGAALAGVLLAYFVAGSAITWLRQGLRSDRIRRNLALTLTTAGAGCTLLGIVLLGRGSGTAAVILEYVLLGAALLVLLPLGVALLSEVVIRWMCGLSGPRSLRLWLGLAGAALFVLSTVLLYALTRSPWLLGAVIVLALLVIAVVSSTQADIAFVMSVIALLGVTPLPADVPPDLVPDRSARSLLVAFGDSYMSGEGASTYYQGTDVGGGNQCRRSPTAWAAMAGQQRPFDQVEFLACSGARTWNVESAVAPPTRPGVPPPEPQAGEERTQLDAYLHDYGDGFTPAMVVAGVGGNDAGFSTIGLMCLAPGTCSSQGKLWTGALEQVRQNLRDTYQQLDKVFPDTPVVTVGYPDPIDLTGRCDDLALAPRERRFLHEFVTGGLNRVVAETSAEFGFHYLAAMESSLRVANLQLCDEQNEGRPGLNFIGVRSVGGVAEQRFHPKNFSHSSLHPNERGHAAMLRTFQTWLPDLATLPARGPITKATADARDAGLRTVSTGQADPQCDVLSASTDGCRTQGMQWAKGRVRMLLLTQGWMGLLPLAGIWLAAVAFFGYQRRRLADQRE